MEKCSSECLKELKNERSDHVKSCEINDDHSHERIAEDIYTNKTRFVYEILQNAEDAQARKVTFDLAEHQLDIRHNGRVFSRDDAKSITTFGHSTKSEKEGKIGKFGVGFKSVYSITTTPFIYSGELNFKIVEYIVPDEIPVNERPDVKGLDTVIRLPFNHPKSTSEKFYKLTSDQLNDLNPTFLLFLKNIKEITWCDKTGKTICYTKIEEEPFLILKNENENSSAKYLVYEKETSIKKFSQKVNIAYLIGKNNEGNDVVKPTDEKVFVFFPTRINSHLKFLIQAPYKTPLNQESINFDDPDNQRLTKDLADLAAETLIDLNKKRLLSADFFLRIYPTPENNGDEKDPRKKISEALKKALQHEPLLPTHNGKKNVLAKDSILPLDEEVIKFLGQRDIQNVFNRKHWLPCSFKKLRELLNSIGVDTASTESFLKKVRQNFIKQKTDNWLKILYGELGKYVDNAGCSQRDARIKTVGHAPIVPLNGGKIAEPWGQDDQSQIYLPHANGHKSDLPTVKHSITNSSKAKKLFQLLSIKQPDELSEIKEKIAPRYKTEKPDVGLPTYHKDMDYICQAFIKVNGDKHGQIKRALDGARIVLTKSDVYKCTNNEVYLPTRDIKVWFEGNTTANIVREDISNRPMPIQKKSKKKRRITKATKEQSAGQKIGSLFARLGCKTIDGIAKGTKYYEFHYNGYLHEIGVDGFNSSFAIDELEYAVGHINLDRSLILWDQLLKHREHIKGYVRTSTNKARLYAATPTEKSSKAGAFLSEHRWLYDKQEDLICPSEYTGKTIDDLHDKYGAKDNDADSLAKALGLDSQRVTREEVDKIRAKIRAESKQKIESLEQEIESLKSEKELENEKLKTKYKELKEKIGEIDEKNDSWSPEYEPEDSIPMEVSQAAHSEERHPSSSIEKNKGGTPSKKVGKWGEKAIYLHLKKQNVPVCWCNENGEQKKPYDMIETGNSSQRYIEVKTTRNDFPNVFNFSESEWEFAQKHGNNYRVYFVSKVGTAQPGFISINNPVCSGLLDVKRKESVTITYKVHV